jgi:hypothetical protein
MGLLLLAGILILGSPPHLSPQASAAIVDQDRDGVDDALEAALLERFRPEFAVSSSDCDQLPAEFAPALPAAFANRGAMPHPVSRNGTIYGQVFRRGTNGGAELLEAHYYDLWTRDCGSRGHALDAEHVSVLLSGSSLSAPASQWTARTWYAAAHQDTVCDVSRYVPAAEIGAEHKGARIWISAGKHASYFSAESCEAGCGKDRCESMVALAPSPVLNLGEPDAPLNGAAWAASSRWPLALKMRSDFPDALLVDGAMVPTPSRSLRSTQAVIGSGAAAQEHSGAALDSAGKHTDRAVAVGQQKAGRSIRRAVGATGRFLGLGHKKPSDKYDAP